MLPESALTILVFLHSLVLVSTGQLRDFLPMLPACAVFDAVYDQVTNQTIPESPTDRYMVMYGIDQFY